MQKPGQRSRTHHVFAFSKFLFSLTTISALLLAGNVRAQNSLLSYRGEVRSGTNRFHGTALFKFALVTATNTVVWSNAQLDTNAEPLTGIQAMVTAGQFSVCLGDTNIPNMAALPAEVFTQPQLHLRLWFDDGTNGSMVLSPDQTLTSVPKAAVAENFTGMIPADKISGGLSPQHFPPSIITSSMLAPGSINPSHLQEGSFRTNHIDTSFRDWVESRSGDTVNVKHYGAKGNGVADDSAAIQACIDSESGTRNTFYFPAGVYRLTQPIRVRRECTRILGDGPKRTFLRQNAPNQHGIILEPSPGNYGGTGAMWNTYLADFCISGPGRTNSTGSGIHFAHPSSPGAYFADLIKLSRVQVGDFWTTGFRYGITVSNCVSVVADLCEFKYCTEAVRLSKCDSAWFVECQTGYTGTDYFVSWRDDPDTVCFNILDRGLGTHILGGEHGHMYRFANISNGSVVNLYGGNFESFADCAFQISDSHVCISNPRISLVSPEPPIFRIANGASKVVVLAGDYGSAKTVFMMETAEDFPNYFGAPVRATNTVTRGSFRLPLNQPVNGTTQIALQTLAESNRELRRSVEQTLMNNEKLSKEIQDLKKRLNSVRPDDYSRGGKEP